MKMEMIKNIFRLLRESEELQCCCTDCIGYQNYFNYEKLRIFHFEFSNNKVSRKYFIDIRRLLDDEVENVDHLYLTVNDNVLSLGIRESL